MTDYYIPLPKGRTAALSLEGGFEPADAKYLAIFTCFLEMSFSGRCIGVRQGLETFAEAIEDASDAEAAADAIERADAEGTGDGAEFLERLAAEGA